jgi:hypothetical protein
MNNIEFFYFPFETPFFFFIFCMCVCVEMDYHTTKRHEKFDFYTMNLIR